MKQESYQRPITAQAAVVSELRRRIGTGELAPGAVIRQDPLAAELGVSKVPIREALKVLQGEGQIVHEPHRGYFVAQLDLSTLLEIYQLRELLETEALRVTVPVASDDLVETLGATATEMEKLSPALDMAEFVALNRRFHFSLFEATSMPHLIRHITLLWQSSEAYRTLYYMHDVNVAQVHSDHADILKAVQQHDADRAIEASNRHRAQAVDRLTERLSARDTSREVSGK